jgi:hypothetical protein
MKMQNGTINKYASLAGGAILVFGLSIVSAVSTASAPGITSSSILHSPEYQFRQDLTELDASIIELTYPSSQK